MHVVICEDERCFQEEICHLVENWKNATGHTDVSCTCFSSSEELWIRWQDGLSAELFFLDIQIPGEFSGMELAKRIRQSDPTASIVFITNYADYVYEGYVVNALRYLRKPIQSEEMNSCLEIAYRHFLLQSGNKLSIDCRRQRLVVPYSRIVYIETQAHYLKLTLDHSNEKPEVRARLRDFAVQLPQQLFCQCHRSYIVNLSHIRRFTRHSLTLSTCDKIPVSKTFAPILNGKTKGDDLIRKRDELCQLQGFFLKFR